MKKFNYNGHLTHRRNKYFHRPNFTVHLSLLGCIKFIVHFQFQNKNDVVDQNSHITRKVIYHFPLIVL